MPSEIFEGRSVLRTAPIRDQVAELLREAITQSRLKPGQLIVEREICAAMSASRASVREALRQLETENLVKTERGRGVIVVRLSLSEVAHIYEVREALEGLAGRLAALRANDEELAALDVALMHIRAQGNDVAALLTAKTAFYDALFETAGNPELRRMILGLYRRITQLRALSLAAPGRVTESVAEVERIVQAIRDKDADTAQRLCVEHVHAAARTAVQQLEELEKIDQVPSKPERAVL